MVIGSETQTITQTETVDSAKKDMETVLELLPQEKETTTEDGFTGILHLVLDSIKTEPAGYGSSTKPVTATRSYPNLASADANHLPKTITEGGRTLKLQDIQWQTDNTYNADDYEIGDRFTAICTYGGSKSVSYVTGYTTTANYTGEVYRTGVTVIRYTVIFTGTPIASVDPEPVAKEDQPQAGAGWPVMTVLGLAALAADAGGTYFVMKRKERMSYEETADDGRGGADAHHGDGHDGHGDYKVIIPVLEAVEEPEDYRGQPKGDVLHYLLNKRLGAEVDYIIKGIDQESGIVAASRLEAMAMKRKEYYFRTDRDGNYQIYAGICAEARVVSVIRAGIFVDLFGAECYIPLRELSYQRWVDATAHYQSGQRVLVRVLEVDRDHRSQLRVSASVKQAGENPYEKALKKYAVGSLYVGTVSMVDTTGVFVSLDGGIDCLCTYPKRGRPPRGCRVSVRILGINYESNRIWGVITHMSTVR